MKFSKACGEKGSQKGQGSREAGAFPVSSSEPIQKKTTAVLVPVARAKQNKECRDD